jgi:methylmalonyl-CoA mutase cobalamin-binding domain/chain
VSDIIPELEKAIVNFDKEKVLKLTDELIKTASLDDALDAITRALIKVGDLYEDGEYFLPDLIYSGEMAKKALDLLHPHLKAGESSGRRSSKVILGTVQGDMHDLGKNIVKIFAEGAGYDVIDLGMNVPAQTFIETIKKNNAKILGISCLLTACDQELYKITSALKSEGLDDVKVVIGGAAMTERVASDVEQKSEIITRFAPDAFTGIRIFEEFL